jgi:signal transduction histidine kinase
MQVHHTPKSGSGASKRSGSCAGFEPSDNGAGQGLQKMKTRAASIGGVLALDSMPGRGTALEVVLRA